MAATNGMPTFSEDPREFSMSEIEGSWFGEHAICRRVPVLHGGF